MPQKDELLTPLQVQGLQDHVHFRASLEGLPGLSVGLALTGMGRCQGLPSILGRLC